MFRSLDALAHYRWNQRACHHGQGATITQHKQCLERRSSGPEDPINKNAGSAFARIPPQLPSGVRVPIHLSLT